MKLLDSDININELKNATLVNPKGKVFTIEDVRFDLPSMKVKLLVATSDYKNEFLFLDQLEDWSLKFSAMINI